MSIEAGILDALKKALGPGGYIDRPKEMEPHLKAWRGGWRGTSPLIALPSSAQMVSEIVKICSSHKIGMVPQGGNTGTVGGCIPSMNDDQIVINFSKLNKIRDLNKTGLTVTADAGVILQNLQDAVEAADLLFPLSMASEGSAHIGGAVSTNAGGTAVLRYGNTRNLVLGVEAVLADGAIYHGLRTLRKDNMGYNLAQYFIGAEGTLGLVTAVSLRLFPKPQQTLTALLATPDAEAALELFGDIGKECGEFLSAFEIMSHTAISLVLKNIPNSRLPCSDGPYYVLVELDSASKDTPLQTMFENVVTKALQDGCVSDAVVASSLAQGKQFWHLRENISEAIRKEAAALHFDIALPLVEIPDFLAKTDAQVRAVAHDIRIAPFGHIGDGNLHYNMCFEKKPSDFAELKILIQDIVYGEVDRRHGSLSAEHGIGTARKDVLKKYKPTLDIDLMRKIKQALDPDGLMNPGKIFD